MLVAVIAGIVTLVVTVVAIGFFVRRRHVGRKDRINPTRKVAQVNTVGVEPKKQRNGFGGLSATKVQRPQSSTGAPSDMLRGRFLAMGVLAAAVFGSLTAKLWSMQVLQSSQYATKADENLYTTVYTPAPRGIIYDASGIPLVRNKTTYTVLAAPEVADDHDVIMRLSALLGIPFEVVRQRVLDTAGGAQNNRVVASDVSRRNLAFISEHTSAFPGVTCEARSERTYPFGTLAAHVLGYTGTVSDEELANVEEGRDVQSGDVVGKNGVEASYDNMLAGEHGTRTLLTDAEGNIEEVVSVTDPKRGNDVYLTIKGPVQRVADQIMQEYVNAGTCTAASCVCMDCRNGEVVALSNYPTYNPESFIGGISNEVWEEFNTEESHYPLMDRAIAGTYPAASTFKAFTAMAALTAGVADTSSSYTCTGTWTGFGEQYAQNCWLLSGHGHQDLISGIANSCDTVFYEIAKGFFDQQESLGLNSMQDHVREYGFGRQTGIDLAGEAAGRLPTPEWKAEYFKDAPEQGEWQGGDMTNMVIGQGYVLVTPLQICTGYCGIATGKVYRPHVLREVRNSQDEVVVAYEPEVLYEPDQSEENFATVREGLKQVITINDYTRFFEGVDYEVAGKTGTAEVQGKDDYSLFACYAPADNPKYVVAIVCEEGPTTITSSIPMAAEVLKAAMAYDDGSLPDTLTAADGTVFAGADATEEQKAAAEAGRELVTTDVDGEGINDLTGTVGSMDEGYSNATVSNSGTGAVSDYTTYGASGYTGAAYDPYDYSMAGSTSYVGEGVQ